MRLVNLEVLESSDTQVKLQAEGMLGKTEFTLPIGLAEFDAGMRSYDAGSLVQEAFPQLNADQREFLMTGFTPELWDATFGGDED